MANQLHILQARDAQGPGGFNAQNNPYVSALSASSASAASASSASAASASSASAASASSASAASVAATAAAATTTASTDDSTTITTSIAFGSGSVSLTAAASSDSTLSSTSDAVTSSPTTSQSSTSEAAATTTAPASVSSPTTFATSAASQLSSNTLASTPTTLSGAASETATLLPLTGAAHHNGMSHSALTAAVVVPILFALFALLLAFLCLRRRNRDSRRQRSGSGALGFLPAMREKLHAVRTTAVPLPASVNHAHAPVVTSERNNAYFTGLDTSSHNSQNGNTEYYAPARRSEGGTFVDPPPPYKAKTRSQESSLRSGSIPEEAEAEAEGEGGVPAAAAVGVPTLQEPSSNDSPFADPPATSSTENENTARNIRSGLLAAASSSLRPITARPSTSRSLTNRSFASEDYSDTASVHSARAARLSVGPGVSMLGERRGSGGSDPFGDPEGSVRSGVSAMGEDDVDGEGRSLTGVRLSFESQGTR